MGETRLCRPHQGGLCPLKGIRSLCITHSSGPPLEWVLFVHTFPHTTEKALILVGEKAVYTSLALERSAYLFVLLRQNEIRSTTQRSQECSSIGEDYDRPRSYRDSYFYAGRYGRSCQSPHHGTDGNNGRTDYLGQYLSPLPPPGAGGTA